MRCRVVRWLAGWHGSSGTVSFGLLLRSTVNRTQRNEAVEVSLLKGRVLRVNGLHYAKLRALYTQHHLTAQQQQQRQQGGSMAMTRAEEALFHERLGCLLFRYQALAAEDQSVTAGVAAIGAWEGLERALPPRVFDVLEQEFGARLECFASPFNCRCVCGMMRMTMGDDACSARRRLIDGPLSVLTFRSFASFSF